MQFVAVEVVGRASAPGGYVVGWGTLALINAALAQNRNRWGLAWFLISVFVGPLATLVLVLLPQRPSGT